VKAMQKIGTNAAEDADENAILYYRFEGSES
jgi:hypothetical protein